MRCSLAVAGLLSLAACSEQPARIEIRLPGDRPSATRPPRPIDRFTEKGRTVSLRAIAYDNRDRFLKVAEVEWSTDDPTVASVSQAGLLTALSSGTTAVVATLGEIEARAPVEVQIVGGITVSPQSPPPLPLGEFIKFEAKVTDDRGRPLPDARVAWESTTWAATVAVDGEVEGRSIGKTTIVATAAERVSARVELTVTDWPKKARRR